MHFHLHGPVARLTLACGPDFFARFIRRFCRLPEAFPRAFVRPRVSRGGRMKFFEFCRTPRPEVMGDPGESGGHFLAPSRRRESSLGRHELPSA